MNLSMDVDTDLCALYKKANLALADKWILSSLYTALKKLNKALESYKFNEAANILYDFIWHKYCDWYVEIAKSNIKDRNTQIVLYKVLEKSLRMLHPFMPFITEELWSLLPHKRDNIIVSNWPHVQDNLIDKKIEQEIDFLINIIAAIRNIRSQVLIPLDKKVNVAISVSNENKEKIIKANQAYIKNLGKVEEMEVAKKLSRPKQSIIAVVEGVEIYVPLAGLIDIEADKSRLSKQIAELERIYKGIDIRLNNKEFLNKAPKDIVKKDQDKQKQLNENIIKLKANLEFLK